MQTSFVVTSNNGSFFGDILSPPPLQHLLKKLTHTHLEEIAASPHGAVEMYMRRDTSLFSFSRCFLLLLLLLFSNKLSSVPGSCSSKFRYKNLIRDANSF